MAWGGVVWSRGRGLWLWGEGRKSRFVGFCKAAATTRRGPGLWQSGSQGTWFSTLHRGRARTQSPTTRNYAVEIPTFGEFARVSKARSAMAKPRRGWTTFVIMVSPLPGKYELELRVMEGHTQAHKGLPDGFPDPFHVCVTMASVWYLTTLCWAHTQDGDEQGHLKTLRYLEQPW